MIIIKVLLAVYFLIGVSLAIFSCYQANNNGNYIKESASNMYQNLPLRKKIKTFVFIVFGWMPILFITFLKKMFGTNS